MEQKQFGFGTAAIGRPLYINLRSTSPKDFDLDEFLKDGSQMLETAYNSGIRYFDTAPGYGASENLLIEWAQAKNDPSIEIATKWGYEYTANFDPQATSHEVKEHSLDMLQKQWAKSKELLPYITTYQIHSATFETGVLQNKKILSELQHIKNEYGLKIGLTTSGENQMDLLTEALKNDLFDVFQITYNIFDQSLRRFLASNNIDDKRIIIKEGLANGRIFRNDSFSHYNFVYDYLDELSNKYNVGVDAIALQFCAQTVPAYSILSGASLQNQLMQNVKSINLKLTDYEIQRLEMFAVSPIEYWAERKQLTWN